MNAHQLTGNRCQCPACGEYFTSSRAFDRHRIGGFARQSVPNMRRCLTAAEMDGAGFDRNARGFRGEPERMPLIVAHSAIPAPRSIGAMVLQGVASEVPQMHAGVTP